MSKYAAALDFGELPDQVFCDFMSVGLDGFLKVAGYKGRFYINKVDGRVEIVLNTEEDPRNDNEVEELTGLDLRTKILA